VRLAARGRRESDAGEEPITDPWLVAQLQRQARDIYIQSALVAAALTAVALLLPGRDGA
jgi:hypothetical protein